MAVVAVAILIGLWLPLVGWTLLGFVVIDSVLRLVARRRADTSG